MVKILFTNLKLKKSTIDLVNNDNRLDTLTKSLSEDSLRLHTDTFNAVDNDKGTVGDTESSSNFGRKVNVARRVDQVDQELVSNCLLGDIFQVLLVGQMRVQGDGGGLDGNASVLLILTSVCESCFAGLRSGYDTSTLDEGIGKGGLSVVDCKG